jgi:TonB family protein
LRSLRNSISVSLSLHFLLGLLCFLLLQKQSMVHPRQLTWIEVDPAISPAQKKALDDDKRKNQVVQTEQGQQVKNAKSDAFLGEHNQTVDRETVSSSRTTAMGKTQQVAKNSGDAKKKSAQKAKQETQAAPVIAGLGVKMFPTPSQPKSEEETARNENWADQASSPQDYVKGIKEGERTALNTKEFVFYGYYQRIRERLDRAWVPILREKLVKYYNTGRHLAAEMDHTTKILVVLGPTGEITAVRVVSESGTRDLDDAAVAAFNEAGPFPNPPHGIIGPDGKIEIPWEFILRT